MLTVDKSPIAANKDTAINSGQQKNEMRKSMPKSQTTKTKKVAAALKNAKEIAALVPGAIIEAIQKLWVGIALLVGLVVLMPTIGHYFWTIHPFETILLCPSDHLGKQEEQGAVLRKELALVVIDRFVHWDQLNEYILVGISAPLTDGNNGVDEWQTYDPDRKYSWTKNKSITTATAIAASDSLSSIYLNRYDGKIVIKERLKNGDIYRFEGTCVSEKERKF